MDKKKGSRKSRPFFHIKNWKCCREHAFMIGLRDKIYYDTIALCK